MLTALSAYPRNRLLATLPIADLSLLRPMLAPVCLSARQVLVHPDEPISHAYFLESGLASVVACRNGREEIEIAMIGREGVVGLPVVLGRDRSPYRTFVQVAGDAFRVASADLRRAMDGSAALRQALLGYVDAVQSQLAETVISNGRQSLLERLARWLLLARDRLDDDRIALTHECLSLMLGSRRAGVTVAVHVLEGEHAIRSRRGYIIILDRRKLEAFAQGRFADRPSRGSVLAPSPALVAAE